MHLDLCRYALSQPLCACFLGLWFFLYFPRRCVVTDGSGPWSLLDVSVGLLQPRGLCRLSSAEGLVSRCCVYLYQKNRSTGRGADFPVGLWFMLVSFDTLKKDALWAGVSVRAWTALLTPKADRGLRRSQRNQGTRKMGNAFRALSEGHRPAKGLLLQWETVASHAALGTAGTTSVCVKCKLNGLSVELGVSFGARFRVGEGRRKLPARKASAAFVVAVIFNELLRAVQKVFSKEALGLRSPWLRAGAYGSLYLTLRIRTRLSARPGRQRDCFFHSDIAIGSSRRWLSMVEQLPWAHYVLMYALRCEIVPLQWGWPIWNIVDGN